MFRGFAVARRHAEGGAVGEDVDVKGTEGAGADVGQLGGGGGQLLQRGHRALVVVDDGGRHRNEVRVRGVAAAGRGQLRRVSTRGSPGELVGVGAGLGDRLQGLQTHEIGLPGQEQLAVGQAQQRGGRVGGVTRLLGGPEGARLGEFTLTFLCEGLGDCGPYLVDIGGGPGGGHEAPRGRALLLAISVCRAATCRRRTMRVRRTATPTAPVATVVTNKAIGMALTDVLPVPKSTPTSYISLKGGLTRCQCVTSRNGQGFGVGGCR
ncbi:hypothetical protein SALBM311S_02664 [Streptomyces alboniger]